MAIVDSSPLVAFINRRDAWNAWARSQFQQLKGPLLVCEPVLTEVLFLLRPSPEMQGQVLDLVHSGALRIAFSLADEIDRVRQLMRTYRNVPMSLADACLVRMAEIHHDHPIISLDSDFHVYRKHDRLPLSVILPR